MTCNCLIRAETLAATLAAPGSSIAWAAMGAARRCSQRSPRAASARWGCCASSREWPGGKPFPAGHYGTRVPEAGSDEFAVRGKSFHGMAVSLETAGCRRRGSRPASS